MELVLIGTGLFAKNMISYLDACNLTTPLINIITYAKGKAGPNKAKAVNTLIKFMYPIQLLSIYSLNIYDFILSYSS